MPNHISGGHNDHYFHVRNDDTQMKTAQRATFLPTPGNKISNKFLQSDNAFVAGVGRFMKKMRQADLGFRDVADRARTGAYTFGVNQRANFEKWSADSPQQKAAVEAQRVSSQDRLQQKAEIKKIRLDYKKKINGAAPEKIDNVIADSTSKFQGQLAGRGYVRSGGLAETPSPVAEVGYMENQQQHRVRTSYGQPPALASFMAPLAGRQHDKGDTGVARAIKRGMQYGVVGAANGVQLARQGFYSTASALAASDGDAHETFLRRARHAGDMRRMNSSSLDGPVALDQTFRDVNRERSAFVHDRLGPKGYREVGTDEILPPEKTRFMARAFDPRVKDAREKMKAAPGEKMPHPWIQRLASAYARIANVKSNIAASYHGQQIRWAEKDIAAGDIQARSKKAYHEGKRFKAMFLSETTAAAAQGTMQEEIGKLNSARRKQELGLDDTTRDDFIGYYGKTAEDIPGETEFPSFNDTERLEHFEQLQRQRQMHESTGTLTQEQAPLTEYYAEDTGSGFGEPEVPAFPDTERLQYFEQLQREREGQRSPSLLSHAQTVQTAPDWSTQDPVFYDEAAWKEIAADEYWGGNEDIYSSGDAQHFSYSQVMEQFYGEQRSATSMEDVTAHRVANGRTPARYDDVSLPDEADYQQGDAQEIWRK